MIDGLYVVSFKTPLGEGAGVVSMRNGEFAGGDSAMVYRGSLKQDGMNITGVVSVSRHSQGMPSVLGVDNARLNLNGHGDDATARLTGSGPEAPGVSVHVNVRRCGDL